MNKSDTAAPRDPDPTAANAATAEPPPHPTAPADEAVIDEKVGRDRRMIEEAKKKGRLATLGTYTRLSGPGWLQSAITLGGGSLAGSLYLGVLSGFSLMWLQPLAMILGVIMLSAIGYVALSTGQRPFAAINTHVNPVLGWGWAIASLMANLVWCMPQFALGSAALQQNLLPGVLGAESAMGPFAGKVIAVLFLFIVAGTVIWFYNSGGRGIRLFESVLKAMVGIVVLCFFGVVVKMGVSGALDGGAILAGFIPDLSLLYEPSASLDQALAATGANRDFWAQQIVAQQRDVMITAAATAVGINMTFLLPYSMLARGWGKSFRGLASFDLATGLFVPFLIATSCVIIASATQFHGEPAAGFLGETNTNGELVEPAGNLVGSYQGLADARIQSTMGLGAFGALSEEELAARREALPQADKRMAAMLVKRDAFNLADALRPLTGATFGQYVFGIGVLGMAISTIIILMLINGFVVCEMLGVPPKGNPHRAGCYMAAVVGAFVPFFWTDAMFWLAVPTSVFGMVLLPIAYLSFALLLNQRKLLGEHMPRGGKRLAWNLAMALAAALAAFGSVWSIWSKTGWWGIAGLGLFIALAIVVHFARQSAPDETEPAAGNR